MPPAIRLVTEQDAEQIVAIYAPIVRNTIISFETVPPSVADMRQNIARTLARLPWLVCEQRGELLGYVYASGHQSKSARQWSVEVSVYVDERAQRSGVGRALYTALFQVLVLQGFYNAYAGITLPNPPSVGLHESLGFQHAVTYPRAGYKHGGWHDVGWWHLALQPHHPHPVPPVSIHAVSASDSWAAAVATGQQFLRN